MFNNVVASDKYFEGQSAEHIFVPQFYVRNRHWLLQSDSFPKTYIKCHFSYSDYGDVLINKKKKNSPNIHKTKAYKKLVVLFGFYRLKIQWKTYQFFSKFLCRLVSQLSSPILRTTCNEFLFNKLNTFLNEKMTSFPQQI